MNAVKKLALLLSLGALVPFAASAKSNVDSYLETCRKDAGVPVPVSVVAPQGVKADDGALVELAFIVDEAGKPTNVIVKSSTDNAFAEASVEAVKQWRFTPATQDGKPVATKVVLPLRAVVASLGSSYAAY